MLLIKEALIQSPKNNKNIEANEQSQRFYRVLVEQSTECICNIDLDGKFTYMSPGGLKIFGVKASEIIGKQSSGLAKPEYQILLNSMLEKAKQGQRVQFQYEDQTKHGTRWFESILAPIRDKNSTIRSLLRISHDITERKEAEESLKISENRNKALITRLPQKVFMKDANSMYLSCNENLAKDLKIKPEQIFGKTDYDFFPRDLAEKYRNDDKTILQTKKTLIFEEDYVVDGEKTIVRTTKAPFMDDKDKVVGILGVFEDITERKQIEEELKFKSMLVDSATDSIFVLNETGKVILVNEAAYKDRGFTKDELIGKPIDQVDAPPYKEKVRQNMIKLQKTGYIRVDTKHIRKDGSLMAVEVNARTFDYKGERVIIGILRDITERKQAEDLSNALNNINLAINTTLNIDEIMQIVVVKSAKAIGSETAVIDIREDSAWIVKYLYNMPQKLKGQRFSSQEMVHAEIVADTKKPLIINNAYEDKRLNQKLIAQYNIRSFLTVPIISKGRTIGALSFHFHSAPIEFNKAQEDFANKVAASVSLAIENSRLYEAQRNIADTMQEALLKVPKKLPHVSFGHLYHSATEATKIGGDFYDLFLLDANNIVISIGDVSGKGLEAASLATLVRSTLKAYSFQNLSPAEILRLTNDIVMKSSAPSTFVTVFFGVLDTKSGLLKYCNAGHPPPILRHKSKFDLLKTSTPAIGIFANQDYINESVILKHKDLLLLYTDGVTEAKKNGELFGEKRLLAALKRHTRLSSKRLPGAIFNDILAFSNGTLSDDIVLFSIEPK